MRVRRVAAVLAACLTVWLLVLAVLVRLGGEAETVAPPRSVPTATGGEAGTGEGAVAVEWFRSWFIKFWIRTYSYVS